MSLILDALRKSDRQRARNAADRLRDGPGAAPPRSFSRALPIIAVCLLASAALAAFIQLNTDQTPASRTAAGSGGGIMENSAAGNHASVRPLASELAIEKAEPVRVVAKAPVETFANDLTKSYQPVTEEELGAPPLATMPAEFRSTLPGLHVDIHAWAEDPRTRFVLINLRRYQEGDRMNEGPVVRRIVPTGVVLEYRDTLFSLPRQ